MVIIDTGFDKMQRFQNLLRPLELIFENPLPLTTFHIKARSSSGFVFDGLVF